MKIKIVKKEEWQNVTDIINKLNEDLEVLKFQRDYKHNVQLVKRCIYLNYCEFSVNYVSICNNLRSLRLPYGFDYKLDKDNIVAIDENGKEEARYKINITSNVLVEIPVKVKKEVK